jgi:hypothetical protein
MLFALLGDLVTTLSKSLPQFTNMLYRFVPRTPSSGGLSVIWAVPYSP